MAYRLDGLCDLYYGQLALTPDRYTWRFDLQLYKDGLLLLGPDPPIRSEPRRPVSQEKLYKASTDYLRFNSIVGAATGGELNEVVANDRTAMLINVSEALHNNRIATWPTRYRDASTRGEPE